MRRVVATLALVAVLMLAFSATALAAPPTNKISNDLTTVTYSVTEEIAQTDWLHLTWTAASGTATVGHSFNITTTAKKNTGITAPIENVLYIIEIKKDGVGALATDVTATVTGMDGAGNDTLGAGVPVGFLEQGYFYFGTSPTAGFTFSATGIVSNTFAITFLAPGSYTITAYAVKLPT